MADKINAAKAPQERQDKGIQVSRDTGYLYLEYLAEFQSISRVPHIELVDAFNRNFAQVLSYITCVDMCARTESETRANWESQEDVRLLMDYNPLIGWKFLPGPVTICLRLLDVRPIKFSSWRRRQKYNWISRLTRLLYVVFSFHLLANLYYQYSHDFSLMRLTKISKSQEKPSGGQFNSTRRNYTETLLEIDSLTSAMRQAKTWLNIIGAPNLNLSVSIEVFYLYVIFVGIIAYDMSLVFYSLVTPFDIHVGRELLDEQNERLHYQKLIQSQAMRYIESNRIFGEILLLKNRPKMYSSGRSNLRQIMASAMNSGAGVNRYKDDQHKQTDTVQANDTTSRGLNYAASPVVQFRTKVAQLYENDLNIYNSLSLMLASGALKTFNKAPGYIDRRSLIMLAYHVVIFGYVSFLIILVNYYSALLRDPARQVNLADSLLSMSLNGLLVIAGLSVNLCGTYFFVACMDELIAVAKLQELIMRCITVNSLQFKSLELDLTNWQQKKKKKKKQQQQQQLSIIVVANEKSGRHSDGFGGASKLYNHDIDEEKRRAFKLSKCADIMNTNLLFVLMQYKIFVAQYYPIKNTLQSFIFYATLFSLIFPIILKAHLAYLNTFTVENVKFLAILWTVSALIASDVNVVPLCHLYSQCVSLYRNLSSLIAHIIAIESHQNGKGLYNQHAISILMKELEHPDQMLSQFKIGSLGMTCTYTTLLKTHFWWGLVVLSIMLDSQFSGHTLFGSFFDDPLNAL